MRVSASDTSWAGVEVAPPLPMNVYTCAETWNPERIGALAVQDEETIMKCFTPELIVAYGSDDPTT
jgi:hypothetical protein